MPILTDIRKTRELSLPSYPDSKVVIFPSFLVGDLTEVDLTDDSLKNGVKTLAHIIKEWNFTDEEGKVLPITEENINKLASVDVDFILKEIKIFAEEEKKSLGN